MILIEIVSDANKELFHDVPKEHHKDLMCLYEKIIETCKNKPQFVKINSFELLRLRFIQNEFQKFDVHDLINEFSYYYKNEKIGQSPQVRYAYLEDLRDVIWDFLNSDKIDF